VKTVKYDPRIPVVPAGERQGKKLSKSDTLALRSLAAIQEAMHAGNWAAVRDASIQLALVAAEKAK
jgi:hypothetical protein